MPRSNRRHVLAIVGFLVAAAPAPRQAANPSPVTVRLVNDPAEDRRNQANLSAAQTAAEAAKESARWAWWQMIFSGAGVVGLIATLWFNRRALKLATEASKDSDAALAVANRNADTAARHVEVAIQTSYDQLRPWLKLTVEPQPVRPLGPAEIHTSVKATIENAGKTPAVDVRIAWKVDLLAIPDLDHPIKQSHGGASITPIFPGEIIPQTCSYQIKLKDAQDTVAQARAANSMPCVVFDLVVSYRASVGGAQRESALRFVLTGAGNGQDWLIKPASRETPHISLRHSQSDRMT